MALSRIALYSGKSLAGLTLGIPGGLANSHGTGGTVFGIASGPKPGLNIQIEPDVLSLQSLGQQLSFVVTIEATWEDLVMMNLQFPEVDLGDKDRFEGEGLMI
ncbi:hypothetical protein H0E87_005426 [Populus deltoides]|uniref:Uncharacterized protein n=1 Tax=Populus deltoides TaxID=3696 RepID=A0A8T2ZJ61_POPDE|nr:hypothetical protein H0E87_005426 [Populus deltoides]